jgi:citrate lyase subunit gamma (acyl carrier protein)
MKNNDIRAKAGSLESCDALVTVKRGTDKIELDSVVSLQYEHIMREKINDIIQKLGEKNLELTIKDNGAVNFVLQARVETAIKRLQHAEKGAE